MGGPIKFCTEMPVDQDQLAEARRLALEENPDNAMPAGASRSADVAETPEAPSPPVLELDDDGDESGSRAAQARLALLHGKKWRNGRTLDVRFMGGSSFVRDKVKRFAMEWTHYANIKLNFNDNDDAQIRIAFNKGGSWSYLGTDALTIAKDKPTMNFGWFDDDSSDTEFSRTTIHEFGHALGCIHEHQNPSVNVPWNKPAVYRYYAQTQDPPWDKAKVDNNIFRKYGTDETQFSAFDRNSIMCYSIPNSLTLGNYEVGSNTKLSTTDIEFISQAYPFPDPGPFEAGWYRFENLFLKSKRSLDTYSNANNAPFMGNTGRYSGQYWKITPISGRPGHYRLTNLFLGDGRSLDTYSNGNNVPFMGNTGNYSGQMWRFSPLWGGHHRLTNTFLGMGRSLDTYSNANNAPFMGTTGNYSGQYWKITRI